MARWQHGSYASIILKQKSTIINIFLVFFLVFVFSVCYQNFIIDN